MDYGQFSTVDFNNSLTNQNTLSDYHKEQNSFKAQ